MSLRSVSTLVLLIGVRLSSTIAWNIAKPLRELTEHLRSFSLHGPSGRLGEQPLAEFEEVASEFNKMAERLEQFEKLNVDRIVYEKGKTEAIIESIEDGIVLIDPKGIVTHINEMAAIILGVELGRRWAARLPTSTATIRIICGCVPRLRVLRIRAAEASGSKSICTFGAATTLTCSSRCRCGKARANPSGPF